MSNARSTRERISTIRAPGRVERGHHLEAWRWNRLIDAVDSHMPIRINGMTFKGNAINAKHREIYELFDISSSTVKVRGSDAIGATNELLGVAGTWQAIAAGSASFDSDITISEDSFIAIKTVHTDSGNTHTLELLTSIPDAVDEINSATFHIPLWFIPWNTATPARIKFNEILDMRHLQRIDKMGN